MKYDHTEIQVWMKRIFWYKLAEVVLNKNIGQKTLCCSVYIFVTLNALIQLLLKRNHLTRKNSLLLSASFRPHWTKYIFLSSIMDRIWLPFVQQQYHILQSFLGLESGQIFFYRLWSQNWKISDRTRTKLEVLRSVASRVVGSSRRPRLHVEPGVDLCEQHPPSPGSTTPRGGRRREAHRRARWHVAAAAWRWWRWRGGEGAGGEEGGEQQHGDQPEQVSRGEISIREI